MSFHNPLLDKEFLKELSVKRERETYARIIALTFQEEPIELIEGKVSSGSINIDGTSAVRRTCSLTMVSPDVDITNTYWALKNKFKLIEDIALFNQEKVLNAFKKNRLALRHFSGTTGYGYGDDSKKKRGLRRRRK